MRMEQLQKNLGTLRGFIEERDLGLEREKEQHLEDIVARIAPGENDPGYKAPYAEDVSRSGEISLQADAPWVDGIKHAMAHPHQLLMMTASRNPHLKRKY